MIIVGTTCICDRCQTMSSDVKEGFEFDEHDVRLPQGWVCAFSLDDGSISLDLCPVCWSAEQQNADSRLRVS